MVKQVSAENLNRSMQDLRVVMAGHMEAIQKLFIDGRITVIVRSPHVPNGTVLMGDDNIEEMIAAVRALIEHPAATKVLPDGVH